MKKHYQLFSLHVQTPEDIKDEVATTEHKDVAVKLCGRETDVAEGPWTKEKGRHKT